MLRTRPGVLAQNHCGDVWPYEISHHTWGRYPASALAPWPHSLIHGAINQQEETRTAHARLGALPDGSRWAASWRRSAARDTTAGHAPVSRAHRCPCSGPCDHPLEKRHPDLTATPLRAKVPLLLERSLHPPRLPGGALLDPARSRASTDRSTHQLLDRLWDEERRCANRQARQPALPAQGQSARRSLSLASVTHAARSPPCPALCAAQSPASRRAAAQASTLHRPRQSPTRSRQFRPLVRRLAHRHRTSEPEQTPAKSPPHEPGYCKPPGAAMGSSIPQRFPRPDTRVPRSSSSNERNATSRVLPTSYSTPRSTTHATTPRRGRRRTPGK